MSWLTLKLIASLTLACVVLIGMAAVAGQGMPGSILALGATHFINRVAPPFHLVLLDVNRYLIFDMPFDIDAVEWSPDGERLALVMQDTGAIYVGNMDSTNLRLLAERGQHANTDLRWSPDGRWISYLHVEDEIEGYFPYVVEVATGESHLLADVPAAHTYAPIWSLDSNLIAYIYGEGGVQNAIYLINVDGTNPRTLNVIPESAEFGFISSQIDWSPDGQSIAFSLSLNSTRSQIYTVNVDTGELRRLTELDTGAAAPVWSPDGRQIAFIPLGLGNVEEIYVMDTNGHNRRRLTFNVWGESHINWSPDGRHIVSALHDGDGTAHVFVINADGTNPHSFPDMDISGRMLTWRPAS